MPKPRRTTHESAAERLGLVIVTTDDLTIRRTDDGYRHANGRRVGRRRSAQIYRLALPPAWTEVRIAREHRAHLQAIGRDAKGRVQYRYHEDWVRVRDAVKAERLMRFGTALGRIRARVSADLKRPMEDRRAVIATAVRLIDRQLLRVGSERYARNGTRGASTLLVTNALAENGEVALDYRAKSGRAVRLSIRDRTLARRISTLRERRARTKRGRGKRGERLFAYRDEDGRRRSLHAREINGYLVEAGGEQVSAKDFRTFAGSALALARLSDTAPPRPVKARAKVVAGVVREVAERLRNTPAVARSSYIHPSIVDAYVADALPVCGAGGRCRKGLNRGESALLRFLEGRFR